jgi:hypothetical protein
MSSAASISLLVILRPAKGRLKSKGAVSQENLAEVMPDPAAESQAREYFEAQGLTVHRGSANSFSIEGPRRTLEKLFSAAELKAKESTGGEMSLTKLPADIRELLEAVAFTEPPAFGPTSFL